MDRIKLVFGTYNSSPVGSTNDQLEAAYNNSYRPFLKLLYSYPKVNAALHYSGVLLEWFVEKHPEIISLLNEMIKRNQIEIIGGPFYNPILAIIPNKDRISQIEYLTTFIRKYFGKRTRGCWIPEKIWEPTLSSNIKTSGMEYTFLDESLFREAGIDSNSVNRVFITEDQGKYIHVFPINKSFSEDFIKPEEIVGKLIKAADIDSPDVYTMMIDGSINNNSSNYQTDGWYDHLFTLLTENRRKIQTLNPGRYIRTLGSVKKIYFPCTSKDRYFRQNFTKYSESNLLYSKMMYMHNIASQVKRDKVRKKNAREEIMMSQCNAAFWHNNTPGIYCNILRKTAYKHLINSEKSTREKGIFTTSLSSNDFDFDGSDEYIYQGQYINAYVHKKGGVLFELDYLPKSWNYLDTMARYREKYHTKENELNGFDWYTRHAFIDHFLEDSCTVETFSSMNFKELGSFVDSDYSLTDLDRERKTLSLNNKGDVKIKNKKKNLKIIKIYDFKMNSIQVKYSLQNLSDTIMITNFASELNLSLSKLENKLVIKTNANEKVVKENLLSTDIKFSESENIREINIHEAKKKKVTISITGSKKFSLWEFPVVTMTKILDKIEPVYQSSCFLLKWPISIEPSKEWKVSVIIKLEKNN